MNSPTDFETWLIDSGDVVIRKKEQFGEEALSPEDRLVYCLWVADYGMRNAGDLATAQDLYEKFQEEAIRLATSLGLTVTRETFALPIQSIEQCYFNRFDELCAEVMSVWNEKQ